MRHALFLLLTVAGCATAPLLPSIDDHMAAGCEYLGQVTGTSSRGPDAARREATEQARRRGANVVVYGTTQSVPTLWRGAMVDARAYRCPPDVLGRTR